MKLFSRQGARRSRRNERLWKKNLVRNGAYILLACTFLGGSFYAWQTGEIGKLGTAALTKTHQASAAIGFRVDEVLVTGRNRTAQEDILSRLDVAQGTPLFSFDINETRTRIADLSWIKDVRVARRLPNKIIVEIEERTPVALWQHNKKTSAIDDSGVLLTNEDLADFKSLPMIVGEEAPSYVAELITLLHAEPTIATHLDVARRIGQRRWDLRLKNDITVKLPEKNVELALRRLARAIQRDDIFSKNIQTIDLRLQDRMTVGLGKNKTQTQI